jgi:hypothetical protein
MRRVALLGVRTAVDADEFADPVAEDVHGGVAGELRGAM